MALCRNRGFRYHQQNYEAGCKQSQLCPDCPKECSPYQTVSRNESIVQRTADALALLARSNDSAWGSYLLPTPDLYGNRVAWNRTILSGHSRGSAYPLHIAYYWRPRRLVFFCGLEDYQGARGAGTIRKPFSHWEGQVGLSTPAPWVQGYQARAKMLGLVPPADMYGLGPFGGSCCENWQATWNVLGIPGQAFADERGGKLLSIPSALRGAHRIYLRGEHQGHGTPVSNCYSLGPTDPFNTGCCAFCGKGMGSCGRGNCSEPSVKCECAATDDAGRASLADVWEYLFTSKTTAGSALPAEVQMHCCSGTCCEDPKNLTGVAQCAH